MTGIIGLLGAKSTCATFARRRSRNPASGARVLLGTARRGQPPLTDNVSQLSEKAFDERKKGIIARLVARAVAREIAAQPSC